MNNLLQLKGHFFNRKNKSGPPIPKFPANSEVSSAHISQLKDELSDILNFWQKHTEINGALVSVHHTRIIPKSSRLSTLLSSNSKPPTQCIRGAKFKKDSTKDGRVRIKHVFTYYVQLSAIAKSIALLEKVQKLVEDYFDGLVSSSKWSNSDITKQINCISKTTMLKVLLDCLYLEKFDIDAPVSNADNSRIVTIYETDIDTKELLRKFGIRIYNDRIINKTTIVLSAEEIKVLESKAPYLVAMNVSDFSKFISDDFEITHEADTSLIPAPTNEPIIGVIDTHFDERVYFKEWVQYVNMMSPDIELSKRDYEHGTAVSSIIVDGPRGNPGLDDGCGRFRVRHFGVATSSGFSSFEILKKIREIVSVNKDIKVWNLSLGSRLEIQDSFISPEGAELDRLQCEYDVIFVVAGTNKPDNRRESMKIGAPADSLNSVVVNAVNKEGKPASYARSGPVLQFFQKPDVCYYGGDGVTINEKIAVCIDDLGARYVTGTSYSAPWIARKLSYMIDVMKLSREVAKALLIDAATAWNTESSNSGIVGYGIVPIKIQDIIASKDDEIKFIMTGCAEEYETFTYNLPVPIVKEKYPFFAKAIMVYFPYCERSQGVDYTATELDIHFGRVDNEAKIKSIDNNVQDDNDTYVYEEDARKHFRKWDNIKLIREKISPRAKPRSVYNSKLWGISIKSKERLSSKHLHNTQFGVVITLKEMYGVNRIDEFIKLCMTNGWLVNSIEVENKINLYNKAEEDIELL